MTERKDHHNSRVDGENRDPEKIHPPARYAAGSRHHGL